MHQLHLPLWGLVLLFVNLSGCLGGAGAKDGPITKDPEIQIYQLQGHDYGVYKPANIQAQNPPLLMVLHGAYRAANPNTDFVADADKLWNAKKLADDNGYIVVFPRSLKNAPYTPGGWWWAYGADENFLTALIAQLHTDYQIDTKRVFAVGHSNGGSFLHHYACFTAGQTLTGFVSLSGSILNLNTYKSYLGDSYACHPDHERTDSNIGVMHIHSTKDAIVPYWGDNTTDSVHTMMNRWGRMTHCNTQPHTNTAIQGLSNNPSNVVLSQWQGCNAPIQTLILDPGGHIPDWNPQALHPILKTFFEDSVMARHLAQTMSMP